MRCCLKFFVDLEVNMKHLGTVILETERLILRRFTLDDAEDAFRNWTNSEKVTKFMTWPPHENIDVTRGYIQYCIDCYENEDSYNWVIEHRESGQVIGSISVVEITETTDCAEVGYCLSDRFWGMGIMPEALNAVIRFLFDEVGVNRIEATHDVNNPNSGRVMEKCGLQFEGTMRQAGRNNQGIYDKVIRAILKEDIE